MRIRIQAFSELSIYLLIIYFVVVDVVADQNYYCHSFTFLFSTLKVNFNRQCHKVFENSDTLCRFFNYGDPNPVGKMDSDPSDSI